MNSDMIVINILKMLTILGGIQILIVQWKVKRHLIQYS